MQRITAVQIEEMRKCGYDRSTIAEAEAWFEQGKAADAIVEQIEAAFADVRLEEGIGLRQSHGIDNYAGADQLRRLRDSDEKDDWRRIDAQLLASSEAAPSFLDGKGLRFHAPAFMVAELRGQTETDFVGRLIYGLYNVRDFVESLTPPQRAAIIACIQFYGNLDQYGYEPNDIEAAIAGFNA